MTIGAGATLAPLFTTAVGCSDCRSSESLSERRRQTATWWTTAQRAGRQIPQVKLAEQLVSHQACE